jgi:hypothetical protein
MRFATEQGFGVGESVIIGYDVGLSKPPYWEAVCLLRGTNWVFTLIQLQFVFKALGYS